MKYAWKKWLLGTACGVAVLVAWTPLLAAAPAGQTSFSSIGASTATALHTDQIIVRYKDGSAARQSPVGQGFAAGRLLDAVNLRGYTAQQLRVTGLSSQVWKLDRWLAPADADALARDIAVRDPDVAYAEPDHVGTAQLVPNDSSYSFYQGDLYQLPAGINAPSAWDHTTGTGVVVAVLDTGYRPHVDLAANILAGYDFIGDVANANDGDGRDSSALDPGDYVAAGICGLYPSGRSSTWHGTHVAGTIAAVTNNGSGIAGIAYGAKILPVRVLGRCGSYNSDVADAIIWASGGSVPGVPTNTHPARVINMSLGGPGACGSTFSAAIGSARHRGTVVIAAAGNDHVDMANTQPANCAGVIAVAAVDAGGAKAAFSNFGSKVALAAPGVAIYSTMNTGTSGPLADSYDIRQGTSMATPHASGVAALMLSANPALSVDDVAWKMIQTTRSFITSCPGCGTGYLDASNAVNSVIGYSPPAQTLLTVSLVSSSGGDATWQVTNPRGAPVILSDFVIVNSNTTAYVTASSCAVGQWMAAGGSCSVSTSGVGSCVGGSYVLSATNSTGVANGNTWIVFSDQSCGG